MTRDPHHGKPPAGEPVTVMTFNIANDLVRPNDLVDALRGSGADLIGLQEVSARQADALREGLADIYPHVAVHGAGIPGKAVVSRHPLLEAAPLEIVKHRPDLRAVVQTPSGPLVTVVAHPEPPRFGRGAPLTNQLTHAQIIALAEALADAGPAVLLGDLNRAGWAAALRVLRAAGLEDAWTAGGQGRGFTLPARWANAAHRSHPLGRLRLPPVARVDYVLHTPHLKTERAWLGSSAGSDHVPVLARLAPKHPLPAETHDEGRE